MTRALLIPVEGPVRELQLPAGGRSLQVLQDAVGGYIEALPVPDFVTGSDRATCYINEEGKLAQLPFNGRATDFLVPGIGLFFGDAIVGPMVVAGFNPSTGDHVDIPPTVEARIRLIEREAGGPNVPDDETGEWFLNTTEGAE